MAAIRMNITLPEKTVKKLKAKVKARERSQVIAEALEMYFKRNETKNLMEQLIADYKSTAIVSEEDREWLDADLGEGNDDY